MADKISVRKRKNIGLNFISKLNACTDYEQAISIFGKFVSLILDYKKIIFYFCEPQKLITNISFEISKNGKLTENTSKIHISPSDIEKILNTTQVKIIPSNKLDLHDNEKDNIDFVITLSAFGETKGFAIFFLDDGSCRKMDLSDKQNLINMAWYLSAYMVNYDKSFIINTKDNLIIETKEYVSNILENMVHGVISIDSKGIVTTFSKGAEILLELNNADVVYRHYESVFPKEIRELINEVKIRLLSEKNIVESEVEYIMQGKFLIPIKFTASLIKDKKERENGLILVCKDSSSVKRLIALQELGNLRAEFLSTASHEFKTPLNLIMGSVGILSDGMVGQINDQQKRLIGLIREGGTRLHKLIKDLLDLSRIEKERLPANETINLKNILEESLTLLKESAAAKNINIIKKVVDQNISINGNHDKIIKIFDNLISNSIKYTPEGGNIFISVKLKNTQEFPESFYRFSTDYNLRVLENAAEIIVEDTGIGISEENYELIFQQFKRVNDPYVQRNEGTGLGLSITRRLVESMGGSISVESQSGKGSKFTVQIPVYLDANHQRENVSRKIC